MPPTMNTKEMSACITGTLTGYENRYESNRVDSCFGSQLGSQLPRLLTFNNAQDPVVGHTVLLDDEPFGRVEDCDCLFDRSFVALLLVCDFHHILDWRNVAAAQSLSHCAFQERLGHQQVTEELVETQALGTLLFYVHPLVQRHMTSIHED